jgi:hypothetical protein
MSSQRLRNHSLRHKLAEFLHFAYQESNLSLLDNTRKNYEGFGKNKRICEIIRNVIQPRHKRVTFVTQASDVLY